MTAFPCQNIEPRLHSSTPALQQLHSNPERQTEKPEGRDRPEKGPRIWTSELESRVKWVAWLNGREGPAWFGQRLTRAGEGGHLGDSGALCPNTRHWETHSHTLIHSHTLTRPCAHTGACLCPPPLGLCAGVFSPVQGVAADRSPRAETSPDLQALPGSQ